MANEYIYRYTSFESFVGLVQKQALTFVLPKIWDDQMECVALRDFIKERGNGTFAIWDVCSFQKTFAQSWTTLKESDAMWRIYSYSNHSIRIKIFESDIEKLNGVDAVQVKYTDDALQMEETEYASLLNALSQKRTAFAHEKEVRLIKLYKYLDEADAERHKDNFIKIMQNCKNGIPIQSNDIKDLAFLNWNGEFQKTYDVSFRHIPDFIKGVMVHPFAEEWYVEVVSMFCKINNIPFEGKSNLYTKLNF